MKTKILGTILLLMICMKIEIALSQKCSDLFFSEYIEGTANNKALEIYNPTNSAIGLSRYSVKIYFNGATDSSGFVKTIDMSGQLNAGEVYIIGDDDIDTNIFNPAIFDTLINAFLLFNGNDAISLCKDSIKIDAIGEIGVDPGLAWTVDTGSTKDYTLYRKPTVGKGQLDWTIGKMEWGILPVDNVTSLGNHANCCLDTTVLSINQFGNDACEYDTNVLYYVQSLSGYDYIWDISGALSFSSFNNFVAVNWGKEGTGKVQLKAMDSIGCVSNSSLFISIKPKPVAKFEINDSVFLNTGGYAHFKNTTIPDLPELKYYWNFGDNTPFNTLKNPTHQYKSTGNYNVELIVYYNDCEDRYEKELMVVQQSVVLSLSNDHDIQICPNPTSGTIKLKNMSFMNGSLEITIYNLMGKKIIEKNINMGNNNQEIWLSLEDINREGTYFIAIQNKAGIVVRKLLLTKTR